MSNRHLETTHNKELCNIFSLPNIVKGGPRTTNIGKQETQTKYWLENLWGRDHFGFFKLLLSVI
jgi:hypothetical protein